MPLRRTQMLNLISCLTFANFAVVLTLLPVLQFSSQRQATGQREFIQDLRSVGIFHGRQDLLSECLLALQLHETLHFHCHSTFQAAGKIY